MANEKEIHLISKLNHDLLILNDTDTFGVKYSGPTLLDIHDMAHTWPLMREITTA